MQLTWVAKTLLWRRGSKAPYSHGDRLCFKLGSEAPVNKVDISHQTVRHTLPTRTHAGCVSDWAQKLQQLEETATISDCIQSGLILEMTVR